MGVEPLAAIFAGKFTCQEIGNGPVGAVFGAVENAAEADFQGAGDPLEIVGEVVTTLAGSGDYGEGHGLSQLTKSGCNVSVGEEFANTIVVIS